MCFQNAVNQRSQTSVLEQMNKYFYFTRTKGLFRICYPKDRPPAGKYIITDTIILLYVGIMKKIKPQSFHIVYIGTWVIV